MNLKSLTSNPWTTAAGLFSALGAFANIGWQVTTGHVNPQGLWADMLAIGIGLGLIAAKDANTHSTLGQMTEATVASAETPPSPPALVRAS